MTIRHEATELWHGRKPLPRAFWRYTIFYGTLINLAFSVVSFGALAAGASGLTALALHLIPLPYNVFAVIAVWRSAAQYKGPAHWAQLARGAALVWAPIATII